MFELFKILYDLKNCSQKNSNLYNELPNPYKIILYKIRGIYFKKRRIIYNKKKDNINYKNYILKILDIYNLLKNYEIEDFLNY